MKQVRQECSQMMQQNNNNLSAVVRRLLKFATHRTGAFETINLIITHLNRVNLVTMKDLQLQHSLEDGFNHINRKLVDFLREPEKSLPDIIPNNDIRSVQQYPQTSPTSPTLKKATRAQ